MDVPVERGEDGFEVRRGEDHAVGHVELAVVLIDHDAEVVQFLLAGEHDGFPDGAFLEFAIAAEGVGIETRAGVAGDGEALGDGDSLPHGAGGDVDAGEDGAGVAVQDAGVGTGAF